MLDLIKVILQLFNSDLADTNRMYRIDIQK